MSGSLQELLNSSDRPTEAEWLEAISEIHKRAQKVDYPDLDDETLAQITDELRQIYDADEAVDRHSIGAD
jgi:hypothetical protein